VITHYKKTRGHASFVLTDSDKTGMGIVAVVAGLAGLSGQAVSLAGQASDTEEEADYVEFELDGKPVKGWLWRSPFKEGDEVNVAAYWQGEHYELYGMARPRDKTVALYPHCSRGKRTHVRNAVKWWGISLFFSLLALAFILLAVTDFQGIYFLFDTRFFWGFLIGFSAFFAIMTFFLTRQWLPFVHLAEQVFRTLELPNPSSIDLVKSSKAQRTDQDPGEFGTFYFRY
jgi:hypothetical protein